MVCLCRAADGLTASLLVVNVHMPQKIQRELKLRAIEGLFTFGSVLSLHYRLPCILTGDFNSIVDDLQIPCAWTQLWYT